MTSVFGFGGLNAGENAVEINPRLYKTWKGLQFNLAYKRDRFNIKISNDSVEVAAAPTNREKHTFVVTGLSVECAPGKSISVKCSKLRA